MLLSLTRQEMVDAAHAALGVPEAALYARLGLTPGLAWVHTKVAGQRWTPHLLVSLALARRGQTRAVNRREAQDCVRAAGLPLIDSMDEPRTRLAPAPA